MKSEYTDFIGVYEDAVTPEVCDEIINMFDRIESTEPSYLVDNEVIYGTGTRRKDFAIALERHDTEYCAIVNAALNRCLEDYVSEYPGLKNIQIQSIHVKVQRTPPGGGYHEWHCELGVEASANRILVWTLYLNDIPEGSGETEFLHQRMRIHPKKGSICLFPASFTHFHRGNMVHNVDKYIATGWYYQLQ